VIVAAEDVKPPARRYFANVNRWRPLYARARALDPRAYDALICAAFLVAAVLEAALYGFHPGGDRWVYLVGWPLAVLPVAWRRRYPALAAPATATVAGIVILLAPDQGDAMGAVGVAALLLELYNLALRTGGLRLVISLSVTAAVIAADTGLAGGYDSVADVLFIAGFVAAPVAAGRALRGRRLLVDALREQTDRLESERAHRVSAAAEEERTRIARELHDLVAHSVSQMTVAASAVRRIAPVDAHAAASGLAAIEQDGRATLTEMRRLLGVLRRDDDDLALVPQPGLSRLDTLAARARDEGIDVALDVEGDKPVLTPGLDLAAFRIVEEALAGVRARGSTGPVRVTVRYAGDALDLAVADDSATGAAAAFLLGEGAGIVGLRERVALYGGEVTVGATPDGSQVVRARLPVDPVPA
jgi:signal transduction histidine kinase